MSYWSKSFPLEEYAEKIWEGSMITGEAIVKGLLTLVAAFLIVPLWAYVISHMIAQGYTKGKYAALKSFGQRRKANEPKKKSGER